MKRAFVVFAPISFAAVTLVAACTKSDSSAGSADSGANARPYTLVVPTSYDASKPTPLVVMLHGYAAYGSLEDGYMHLSQTAESKGFLYAYADGLVDSSGSHFWNATDACCNFDHNPVDDVAFIDWIIDDVSTKYAVDAKRVFLIGHSNGGFMAHRYACERASRVAAIVSLAGAVWNDPSRCNPSEPVAVAQVHGDADEVIAYDGGTTNTSTQTNGGVYPSAHQTVATWAAKDQCTQPLAATGKTLDLDTVLAGAETVVEAYGGCAAGSAVELWTIHGGSHIPQLGTSWGDAAYAFLSAHPKP